MPLIAAPTENPTSRDGSPPVSPPSAGSAANADSAGTQNLNGARRTAIAQNLAPGAETSTQNGDGAPPGDKAAATKVALSVVILNWNARDYLVASLRSIIEQEWRAAVEIIVVDNNSNLDDSVAVVRRDFPEARLIAHPVNAGFAAGNNLGLRAARGEYILFLNPDTVVHPGALDTLVEWMDAHPRAGACGPKLLNSDGSLQTSCRAFPSFGAGLFRSTFLGRLFPNNPWTRSYLMLDFQHDREAAVDWLSGAALCVRRAALEQIGAWDESFFMYCEDVDLCYRLKEAGWDRVYLPQAVVTHRIGASSDWIQGTTIRRHHASMLRYYVKHHGHGLGALLVPVAAAGIAARALSATTKLYAKYLRFGLPNRNR